MEIQKNFIEKLGCWINDEAHYMGCDKERGSVWEKTYILISKLSQNVQLIALSATIDDKIKFSNWIGSITKKKNYIISTNKRIIPLKHYLFMDNKTHLFLDENKKFNDENYKLFIKYKVDKSPKYLLNEVVKFLKEKDLLQSRFFCYGRVRCEVYAKYLEMTLVDSDEISQIDFIINKSSIVKKKLNGIYIILELFKYKLKFGFKERFLLPTVSRLWLEVCVDLFTGS